MFTLTGVPRHRRKVAASITWDNGRLSGDTLLVAEARDTARLMEGRTISFPGGPKNHTEHLKDANSSAWILSQLFRPETVQVSGEIPAWPEASQNAVQ